MITAADSIFMERAVSLASKGLTNVAPNPHVGAVIVHNGKIIGEGFHRRCGEAHAEVNAVNSVPTELRHLLPESTIYVTLEPCAHYGKTPPCARLLIDCRFRRVVVGCQDPNPRVDGGGIAMMRQAGIEVDLFDGEMARLCHDVDPAFFTRFEKRRPWITLKWAQSADGFMAGADGQPVQLSTPLTRTLVHRLRAAHEAILTSGRTVLTDNPILDCRCWPAGKSPLPVILDRSGVAPADSRIFMNPDRLPIYISGRQRPELEGKCRRIILDEVTPATAIETLQTLGIGSVLVETGPVLLSEFIKAGLYDVIRTEISPVLDRGSSTAPEIVGKLRSAETIDGNTILTFTK